MSERKGAEGVMTVLVARIGDRRVAFRTGDVDGVVPLAPLARPPTLPRAVVGFLPYRGAALPVLDAGVLLGDGASGTPSLYAHILILPGLGRGGAGLLVDRVEMLADWDEARLLPVEGAETLNGCAVALGEADGLPVHLLATGRLLAAQEAAILKGLREAAAARLDDWGVPA